MKYWILVILFFVTGASAQSTEFTFQGRLTDGAVPATAVYDFEFRLFAVETGGSAIAIAPRPGVSASSGVFAVKLDFGPSFDGTPRWLEIAVRPVGGASFTVLAPRQSISSAPYAIRSLASSSADTSTNSMLLGGVPANQFVVTTDTRLSDARDPLPNSPNYINNTTTLQASANFNVSGNGAVGGTLSANVVTSATQFNIGINRALSLSTAGVSAGRLAGVSTTSGSGNTFVGDSAGRFNTTASNNSFFGRDAGLANTASDNSFFGAFAGDSNTIGTRNSYFGRAAGETNSQGNDNSFFGYNAGRFNIAGGNSFFGSSAGQSNTFGASNTFVGHEAGLETQGGSGNSFVGFRAGLSNTGNTNSFFGAGAGALSTSGNNNSFFGSSAGENNATAEGNSFFGSQAGRYTTGSFSSFFGNEAGRVNTTGNFNAFFGNQAGDKNTTGSRNSFFGSSSGSANIGGSDNAYFGFNGSTFMNGSRNTFVGSAAGVDHATGSQNTYIGFEAGLQPVLNVRSGTNNTAVGAFALTGVASDFGNTAVGANARATGNDSIALGANARATGSNSVAIGVDVVALANEVRIGNATSRVQISGKLLVDDLDFGGIGPLCMSGPFLNVLSECSSSLRYKTDVLPFTGGLDIVRRLQPIKFTWKANGMFDVGFGAEQVASIEPLLATYRRDGLIEGVKYGQITTVLVNAVNEQQMLIEKQASEIADLKQRIEGQQRMLEALRGVICKVESTATLCKEEHP